jgi:uncharacterized protein YdhG (YjbR/CyaY superfamily)
MKARPPVRESAGAQVREYLAALPAESRKRMKQVRAIVRSLAPRATEVFSYGIPGFRLEDRALVWYAAFKNHISLYPMTEPIRRAHAAELKGYKTAKGTVQFPLDEPLPLPLVKRLVQGRAAQAKKEAAARRDS